MLPNNTVTTVLYVIVTYITAGVKYLKLLTQGTCINMFVLFGV